MPIITGSQGPFAANAPGANGGNASYQVMLKSANRASLTELAESTVEITPQDSFVKRTPEEPARLSKTGLDDYFRYAEQDIAQFDSNKDGKLNEQELEKGFGGGAEASPEDQAAAKTQADHLIKALSPDAQPGEAPTIDAVKMTSYLIAQDAPKQLFAGLGFDGLLDASQTEYQKAYDQFYPGEKLPEMAWDGKASPAERHATDKLIQGDQTNAQVGVALKGLQQGLQLDNNYQQYKTRVQQYEQSQQPASAADSSAPDSGARHQPAPPPADE